MRFITLDLNVGIVGLPEPNRGLVAVGFRTDNVTATFGLGRLMIALRCCAHTPCLGWLERNWARTPWRRARNKRRCLFVDHGRAQFKRNPAAPEPRWGLLRAVHARRRGTSGRPVSPRNLPCSRRSGYRRRDERVLDCRIWPRTDGWRHQVGFYGKLQRVRSSLSVWFALAGGICLQGPAL